MWAGQEVGEVARTQERATRESVLTAAGETPAQCLPGFGATFGRLEWGWGISCAVYH